jgi:hypothetical protein
MRLGNLTSEPSRQQETIEGTSSLRLHNCSDLMTAVLCFGFVLPGQQS